MKEHFIFIGKVAGIALVVVIAYNQITKMMAEKAASKSATVPTPTATAVAPTSPAPEAAAATV